MTLNETLAAFSEKTVRQVEAMTIEERDELFRLYQDSQEEARKRDEKKNKRLSLEV